MTKRFVWRGGIEAPFAAIQTLLMCTEKDAHGWSLQAVVALGQVGPGSGEVAPFFGTVYLPNQTNCWGAFETVAAAKRWVKREALRADVIHRLGGVRKSGKVL